MNGVVWNDLVIVRLRRDVVGRDERRRFGPRARLSEDTAAGWIDGCEDVVAADRRVDRSLRKCDVHAPRNRRRPTSASLIIF